MRILVTVIVAFLLDVYLHSLYASSFIALGISVSMLTSSRQDDRDFGIFVLGYALCDVWSHYEIDSLGKEKVLEHVVNNWIDTSPKVWFAIGILTIITYGMKNLFNPQK